MVSPRTKTRGRGSSKSLHFLIPGERGFCAPFPYSANVAQPDKSEVEGQQNLSERGTLVPQIRAGLIHKRD